METQGLSTAQILSTLQTLSPHGDLALYVPVMAQAVRQDPDFFAHLVAWNHQRGEIRDAKAALPVIQLAGNKDAPEYFENALAHLADFNPKLLVKALMFLRALKGPRQLTQRFVLRYLRDLEGHLGEWETTALQHQKSLQALYRFYHVPRPDFVGGAFGWRDKDGNPPPAKRGKFQIVQLIPRMTPPEVILAIERHKLPWLVVRGALGVRAKEPDMLMALMGRMTAADLATSAKWLVRAGVKDHAHTRAAFEQLLVKSVKPRKAKGTILKTAKAAKVLQDLGEEKIAGKLQAVQEKQLEQLRTVEGNWLIIGDKSNSMQRTIELAKEVAGLLARVVKGEVHLVFADTEPHYAGNVSGKSLEAIHMTTAAVHAGGGTSLGCALDYAIHQKWQLDGIAVVSDGAENTYPALAERYAHYAKAFTKTPTVYWYRTAQDQDHRTPLWIRQFEGSMQQAKSGMTTFDLRVPPDAYSLPNLIQTMRTNKYSLVDEIRSFRLRTLDEVLTRTVGMGVLSGRPVVAR